MTANSKLFDGIAIFNQVVTCGGFSAAAEQTGHSTSYISKEVNKLEARLGVRLLNRTTRSIGLTPEGEVFYQHCQLMVQDTEHAIALVNQSDVSPKGTLKISCPVGFGSSYLQPIISDFMRLYPQVKVVVDLNDRKVDVIQDGFDLVIRATGLLEESSLICRKIHSSKAITVASAEYLAQRGHPKNPQELVAHDCICYANHKTPTRWQYKDKNNKPLVVEVEAKVISNSSAIQLSMALDHHGIARLPVFNMEQSLKDDRLVELFSDYPPMIIDVFVVYPSRKYLSPKIRSFVDHLVEHLSVTNIPISLEGVEFSE